MTIEALAIARAGGTNIELSNSGTEDLAKFLPGVLHWLFTCTEQVRMLQRMDEDFAFLKVPEFRYYEAVFEFVQANSGLLTVGGQISLGLLGTHFRKNWSSAPS